MYAAPVATAVPMQSVQTAVVVNQGMDAPLQGGGKKSVPLLQMICAGVGLLFFGLFIAAFFTRTGTCRDTKEKWTYPKAPNGVTGCPAEQIFQANCAAYSQLRENCPVSCGVCQMTKSKAPTQSPTRVPTFNTPGSTTKPTTQAPTQSHFVEITAGGPGTGSACKIGGCIQDTSFLQTTCSRYVKKIDGVAQCAIKKSEKESCFNWDKCNGLICSESFGRNSDGSKSIYLTKAGDVWCVARSTMSVQTNSSRTALRTIRTFKYNDPNKACDWPWALNWICYIGAAVWGFILTAVWLVTMCGCCCAWSLVDHWPCYCCKQRLK